MSDTATVDVHAHYFASDLPEITGDGLAHLVVDDANTGRIMLGNSVFRSVERALWDVPTRLRDMDDAGVGIQVISPVPVTMVYGTTDSAEYAGVHNDSIAQAVTRSGGRLIGFGTLPLPDVDDAQREIRRIAVELGLQGIEIGARINDLELDDPQLTPIFAAAEELDLAVFVHPVDGGAGAVRRTGAPYDFGLGMLTDTALAATALVFGGVLERFPRLRVMLAHGCGTYTWAYPRLRVAASLRGTHDLSRLDALTRRLYVDSLVFDPEHLRQLAHRFGSDRILVGSDYPFFPSQPQDGIRDIRRAASAGALGSGGLDGALHRNALEYLGIRVTA